MITIEERLQRAAAALDEAAAERTSGRFDVTPDVRELRPAHRDHRRTVLAAAAVALLLAGVMAIALVRNDRSTTPVAPVEPANTWVQIDGPPLDERVMAAVSGGPDGVAVWGGDTDLFTGMGFADGAFRDPATGRWQAMSDAPFAQTLSGLSAVWSGGEFVVVGTGAGGTDAVEAAAWDPDVDTWRRMSAPDRFPDRSAQLEALDDGRLAWFPLAEIGITPVHVPQVYDPATDAWSGPLEPPSLGPFGGGGSRSVATGIGAVGNRLALVFPGRDCSTVVDLYDAATATWATIDLPVGGWDPAVVRRVGEELLIAGGTSGCDGEGGIVSDAVLVDPAVGAWRAVEPVPVDLVHPQEDLPSWSIDGGVATVTIEGRPAVFDGDRGEWWVGPSFLDAAAAPGDEPQYLQAIDAALIDDTILVTGAMAYTSGDPLRFICCGPDDSGAARSWAFRIDLTDPSPSPADPSDPDVRHSSDELVDGIAIAVDDPDGLVDSAVVFDPEERSWFRSVVVGSDPVVIVPDEDGLDAVVVYRTGPYCGLVPDVAIRNAGTERAVEIASRDDGGDCDSVEYIEAVGLVFTDPDDDRPLRVSVDRAAG